MFFPCVKILDLFDTMQELPDFQLVQRGRRRVTTSALSEIGSFPLSPPHAIDAIQGSEVLALVFITGYFLKTAGLRHLKQFLLKQEEH